jgi:hypothetical protein
VLEHTRELLHRHGVTADQLSGSRATAVRVRLNTVAARTAREQQPVDIGQQLGVALDAQCLGRLGVVVVFLLVCPALVPGPLPEPAMHFCSGPPRSFAPPAGEAADAVAVASPRPGPRSRPVWGSLPHCARRPVRCQGRGLCEGCARSAPSDWAAIGSRWCSRRRDGRVLRVRRATRAAGRRRLAAYERTACRGREQQLQAGGGWGRGRSGIAGLPVPGRGGFQERRSQHDPARSAREGVQPEPGRRVHSRRGGVC